MVRSSLMALLFLASPVWAQQPSRCAPMDKVKAALLDQYDELPAYAAQGDPQSPSGRDDVLVVFTNPDTRTFTLVLLHEDGRACPIFAGDSWHTLPKPQSEPGVDQ